MRELDPKEVGVVSGGAFSFIESAKTFYSFLIGEKNPFNGAVIGKSVAEVVGKIMHPMINSLITILTPFVRK